MKRFISTLLVAGALAGSVQAYDLPSVNLGFTSFLDGAPPAGPGFYLTEYLQFYTADKFAGSHGGGAFAPATPKVDVYASLSQVIYQSNQPILLGGKWGVDFILPVVNFDLKPGGSPLSDNGTGIGDCLVGPYIQWDPIMGKNGPVFVHRIELQCITPTGRYSATDALNPGANFFSFDPYWAATWFPTPKCELSWRIHYLWNDENDEPFVGYGVNRTQAGDAVHLNFASSYELLPHQLRAGINGYYLKQLGASTMNGHAVTGREQVLGLGPGAIYSFSQNDHIFANIYFELAAENRPEGERYILRWVHHF